ISIPIPELYIAYACALLSLTSSIPFFVLSLLTYFSLFFFFNDTATTEIYTLSLHDALPISFRRKGTAARVSLSPVIRDGKTRLQDRKSTRLNSSHLVISYAVFCLKKKKKQITYYIL